MPNIFGAIAGGLATGIGAGLAADIEEQRKMRLEELKMFFQSSERVAGQDFTAGQNDRNRQLTRDTTASNNQTSRDVANISGGYHVQGAQIGAGATLGSAQIHADASNYASDSTAGTAANKLAYDQSKPVIASAGSSGFTPDGQGGWDEQFSVDTKPSYDSSSLAAKNQLEIVKAMQMQGPPITPTMTKEQKVTAQSQWNAEMRARIEQANQMVQQGKFRGSVPSGGLDVNSGIADQTDQTDQTDQQPSPAPSMPNRTLTPAEEELLRRYGMGSVQ